MISDGSEKKKTKKNNCSQLKKRTYLTIQSDKPSTKCKTVQKKKKHTPIVRHILLKKTQSDRANYCWKTSVIPSITNCSGNTINCFYYRQARTKES